MATKELRELRHKYKQAYTVYMTSVQALSDATQNGVWPSPEQLRADEKAYNDLAFTRRALMDALYDHTHGTHGGKRNGKRASTPDSTQSLEIANDSH